jgi:hypothetical protein
MVGPSGRFSNFVSCADVDLTASVIWRDSIAAQVPDQNSRMSWRKAAPRLTWTLPLAYSSYAAQSSMAPPVSPMPHCNPSMSTLSL